MKSLVAFFLTLVMAYAATGAGQQFTETSGRADPTSAKVREVSKTAPAAKTPASKAKASKPVPVDPDLAYKSNCSRCHLEPRKYSERKTATIVRHMRVRANMTAEETEAVLRYLTK